MEDIAMTKTLTFAVVHFTVAFTVGWALSGSVLIGGAIALVEPAINTVAYFFHEKLWDQARARARTPATTLAG
jgi:uncharacterized membrane protein